MVFTKWKVVKSFDEVVSAVLVLASEGCLERIDFLVVEVAEDADEELEEPDDEEAVDEQDGVRVRLCNNNKSLAFSLL